MRNKLKPCPFCGGEAGIDYEPSSYYGVWITCSDCGVKIRSQHEEIDAVKAWNRRSARRTGRGSVDF